MATQTVHIIGIGDDGGEGLTSAARQILDGADMVFGAKTTLDRIGVGQKGQAISGDLGELVQCIGEDPNRRQVILATGDPLFYGVAR